MDWELIRAHYVRTFEAAQAAGATQHGIAVAGGLSQNAISKLLANRNRGPSVETFVRAVHGLGLPLSVFFAGLETGGTSDAVSPVDSRRRQHPSRSVSQSDLAVIRAEVRTTADALERRLERLTRKLEKAITSANRANRKYAHARSTPRVRQRNGTTV